MNLKNLDLEAVRESILRTAKRATDEVDAAAKDLLAQIQAAAEVHRDLSSMPSGELLERAILAEVIPLNMAHVASWASGRLGDKFKLKHVEVRTTLVHPEGGEYHAPQIYVPFKATATLEVGKEYRALVFIVERKP